MKPDEVLLLLGVAEGVEPMVVVRIADQAIVAVQRVMSDEEHSEMRQVYEDDESGVEEWMNEMKALIQRIKIAIQSAKKTGSRLAPGVILKTLD